MSRMSLTFHEKIGRVGRVGRRYYEDASDLIISRVFAEIMAGYMTFDTIASIATKFAAYMA